MLAFSRLRVCHTSWRIKSEDTRQGQVVLSRVEALRFEAELGQRFKPVTQTFGPHKTSVSF
jgi:hypothetical protein